MFFSSGYEKETRRFPVEATHEGEEFAGVLLAEPVDQSKGAVRARGMDEPAGRFVDDQKPGIRADDGGVGDHSDT